MSPMSSLKVLASCLLPCGAPEGIGEESNSQGPGDDHLFMALSGTNTWSNSVGCLVSQFHLEVGKEDAFCYIFSCPSNHYIEVLQFLLLTVSVSLSLIYIPPLHGDYNF